MRTKETLLEELTHAPEMFDDLDSSLKKDKVFLLEAIKQNAEVILYLPTALQLDADFILKAVEINKQSIIFIDTRLKDKPAFAGRLLTLLGVLTTEGINEIKDPYDDQEIMVNACKKTTSAIALASEKLRSNTYFFKHLCRELADIGPYLSFFSTEITTNAKLMKETLFSKDYQNFPYLPQQLKDDLVFVKSLLDHFYYDCPPFPEPFSPALADDMEIANLACTKNINNLACLSLTLRSNRSFINHVLKDIGIRSSLTLQHLSPDLQEDAEIVMEFCKRNANNIQFASTRIKHDKAFIKNIIRLTLNLPDDFLKFLPHFQNDKDIVSLICTRNISNLAFVSSRIKKNKSFLKKLLQDTSYCSPTLLDKLPELSDSASIAFLICTKNMENIHFLSPKLKENTAFIEQLISKTKFKRDILKNLPLYQDNLKIVSQACRGDIANLCYASERIIHDESCLQTIFDTWLNSSSDTSLEKLTKFHDMDHIALLFCKRDTHNVKFISMRLKQDPQFIRNIFSHIDPSLAEAPCSELQAEHTLLELLKKTHEASILELAEPRIKENKSFIKAAILIVPDAYHYATPSLKEDKELCKDYLLRQKPEKLDRKTLPSSIWEDNSFWLDLAKQSPEFVNTYSFTAKYGYDKGDFQDKEELWLELIKLNPAYSNKIPKKLRMSHEFVLKALSLDPKFIMDQSLAEDQTFIEKALSTALKRFPHNTKRHLVSDLTTLKKGKYQPPSADEIELYQQVSRPLRLGRLNLPISSAPSEKNLYLPIETCDSFSAEDTELGKTLKYQKEGELALFEYSIFQPNSMPPKGIIITCYPGHAGHNFNTNSRQISESEEKYLDMGYMVVNLVTHDNWQTIEQWHQVPGHQSGIHLLNTTLRQLFTFTDRLKQLYAPLPIIFYGASYGGYYGALINLLLSNKNKLASCEGAEIFAPLLPLLERIPATLFDGFILHNGGFKKIQLLKIEWKEPLTIPTLALQNFDDERVPIDTLQEFISTQLLTHNLHVHITPQGAPSFLQLSDGNNTSLEGHFTPAPSHYNQEYYRAVSHFLNKISACTKPDKPFYPHQTLTKIRYDNMNNLMNSSETQNLILRLYQALLHHKDSHNNPDPHKMLDRIIRTISTIVYHYSYPDKEAAFKLLLNIHALPLLIELRTRRKNLFVYTFFNQKESPKRRAQRLNDQQQLTAESKEEILDAPISSIDTQNTKNVNYHFTLTENALSYLRTYQDPLELLNRTRKYVKQIDKEQLEYFNEHPSIETIDDFKALWKLNPKSKLAFTIPLEVASRVFSIIRITHYAKDALKILHYIQHDHPMEISALVENDFKVRDFAHLAQILKKEKATDKKLFIKLLGDLSRSFEDKTFLINWLDDITPEDREMIARKYLIAYQKLNNDKEKINLIQKHPELLKRNFDKSDAEYKAFFEQLKMGNTTSTSDYPRKRS